MVDEVKADGLGSVRIIGDIVRLEFVGVAAGSGRFERRALVVLPVGNLDGVINTLTKARGGLQSEIG